MEDLFQTALGLTYPWYIESLNFDTDKSRLDIYLNFARYALLKNKSNLTAKQKTIREGLCLPGLNLKPVRALQIRETFQQLYTAPGKEE